MAHRGLRKHLVLQCTFGLVLFLAGYVHAQPGKPIDPTRITEFQLPETKPCPHYASEVLSLNRGKLFFPTPNSMKVGAGPKFPKSVQVTFDSIRFGKDSESKSEWEDKRVLLYLDCAGQDEDPVTEKSVIWNYRAMMHIPELKVVDAPDAQFNIGSVQVNVTGDSGLVELLAPYNGMEVILRLVEEPEGVNRLLIRRTVLKVILPDRRK